MDIIVGTSRNPKDALNLSPTQSIQGLSCADVALLFLALIGLAILMPKNDAAGGEFRAQQQTQPGKVQSLLKDHPDLAFSHNNIDATALHWASANGHEEWRGACSQQRKYQCQDKGWQTPLTGQLGMATKTWQVVVANKPM